MPSLGTSRPARSDRTISRGLGHVQRILNRIAAEPNGAWTINTLCRMVYGQHVTKVQREAVNRALRHMTLPGTWAIRWSGGRTGCAIRAIY